MTEEQAPNPGTTGAATPGALLAGVEAFVATVDALCDDLARSSSAISGGLRRLEATTDAVLANHASLRARIVAFASATESPGTVATEALELLGSHASQALLGDDIARLPPAIEGLDGAIGQTCEILTSSATRLAEDGFAANARATAALSTGVDNLRADAARAVQATTAFCQQLSRRLDGTHQEVSAALRGATNEAATPALAALDEALATLQAFGTETLASSETLFSDAFEQLGRTFDALLAETESLYGEWLSETEELAGEAERHLRTTITSQVAERAEHVKQDAATRGAAALEEARLDVESIHTIAARLAALTPQIVCAKQACLALAEVMHAIDF